MKKLSSDINLIIKRVFNKHHPLLAEIIINWDKIVGLKFCATSHPINIINRKEKRQKMNILRVQVDNSSIALAISFQHDIIIERISTYLGFKAIDGLHVVIFDVSG